MWVQWKEKIKILITQSCLNPNSHAECVGHWWRLPRNINIYYEDVCIDWAVKWFKVIYAIPIIELHSKEHQCSHYENWKRWFWFIKLLCAATRYWTKRGKVNIKLWSRCLAVRKKDQRHIGHHDKRTETEQGDLPGGAVDKNPLANAGDMGSSPGPRRSHMPWSN